MKIYDRIDGLIGNTPLLKAERFAEVKGLKATLLLKLEYLNPAGSAKDRVALKMLDDAEQKGVIGAGATIIEPTSGNTGIGLAAVGARRGYRVIITMPDTMSAERRNLMKAYGAEVVLTDGALGMTGAIKKAEQLALEIPGSFIPDQFGNPANPEAHFETTGPEIWDDTDGKLDIFVAGAGTGGTLTGTGRYLKSKNPDIKVYAVEPADSPLLSDGRSGPHGIQGIGANFVPSILDTDICDGVMTAETEASYEAGRLLARTEGILVGISSGAALDAACRLAAMPENEGKVIVALLPDTGDRYLSTDMYGK